MNPEDNNPLSNLGGPTAGGSDNSYGTTGGSTDTGLVGSFSTSSGMSSAGLGQGLGEIVDNDSSEDSSSSDPYSYDEPLVPAAPVPGSIGSAISAPPAADTSSSALPSTDSAYSASSYSTTSPMGSGPMPAPAVAPQAPTSSASGFTPYTAIPSNPAATTASGVSAMSASANPATAATAGYGSTATTYGATTAGLSGSATSALGATPATGATPASSTTSAAYNPFAPRTATSATSPAGSTVNTANTATVAAGVANPAATAAAPATAAMEDSQAKAKKSAKGDGMGFGSKKTSILLAILAALFMVSTVVMTILYIQAANKPEKIIYKPSPDAGQTSSKETLKCSGEENYGYLVGSEAPIMGTRSLVAQYNNDELESLAVNFSANFADDGAAVAAKDALMAEQSALMASVANSFNANYNTNGATMVADISTKEDFTDADAAMFLYGLTDGSASTSIETLQEKYQGEGMVCNVE